MAVRPPTFRPRGQRTVQEKRREIDERRGSAASRGYTGRWAKASATFLKRNPLCEYCRLRGRPLTPSTCTDHLYPHRWPIYQGVFWRSEWWVASCDTCHKGFKQSIERRGSAALDALARQLGRPVFAIEAGEGVGQSLGPPA